MPKKTKSSATRDGVPLAPPNIGFRIDEPTQLRLGRRADAMDASPHDWARRCLLQVLSESEDREAWVQCLKTLQEETRQLRNDLAIAVQALLICAGRMQEDKAKAWIEKNMKPG